MWETTDPDGREVFLNDDGWSHIIGRHADLERHREEVLAAVRRPTERMSGRRRDEEFYYVAGAGPSRWIKVVVHYEHDRGRIVTAFPRRRLP